LEADAAQEGQGFVLDSDKIPKFAISWIIEELNGCNNDGKYCYYSNNRKPGIVIFYYVIIVIMEHNLDVFGRFYYVRLNPYYNLLYRA